MSLVLNIEQYEYMPGPHDAAGLKLLLHHPHQFPDIQGLGAVLPAGMHAFIGTRLLTVSGDTDMVAVLRPKCVRFEPNGTHPGLFKISF